MKVRNDFVSNSSSSSFICSAEDAFKIELFNKSEILSLHEYLDKFGQCDVFSNWWWYNRKKLKMTFVNDCEFSKKFKKSICGILPKSAEDAYYDVYNDMFELTWSNCEKLWNAVKSHIENALVSEWGNTKFEYYEAEDCVTYGENDHDYDTNNEESFLSNWFLKHNMNFSREFSNH